MKNKKQKKVFNPTGLPPKEKFEFGEHNFKIHVYLDASTVGLIKEKLKSKNVEDHECAAVMMANFASDEKFLAALIDEKLIKVAAPLMLDNSLSIRHAVTGCLRYIAACGDVKTCDAMIEQGVMSCLNALFQEYKDSWMPVEKSVKIDSKRELFIKACNLLWNLCENSVNAVKEFSESNFIHILLPYLDIDTYGIGVTLAVVQSLHAVSECKDEAILKEPTVQLKLEALMLLPTTDSNNILLRTLAAGIKLNVYSSSLHCDSMKDVATSILKVVSSTFSEQINVHLESLKDHIEAIKGIEKEKKNNENALEEKCDKINKTIEILETILSAKQISSEILGSFLEDEDEEGEWDDMSSAGSEDATLSDEEMEVDNALTLSSAVHEIIVKENFFEKVLQQIMLPKDDTMKILEADEKANECLKKIETFRCITLLCMNNMMEKLSVDDLSGPAKISELWIFLGNLLLNETDLNDIEKVEAITRLLGATVRKLSEAKYSSQFSQLEESHLQFFIKIFNQTLDPRIKVHIIHVVGGIGYLIGFNNTPTSANLIKMIGLFLLDICSKGIDMWVTTEALDAIFDVFAEDPIDVIAQEINLVGKLMSFLPMLKAKIKQQKKHLGDHLPVIMTAKENLLRFINYKNNLHKK
ncbi:HEAT repeat-containing protein 3 [Caerostris extrusa]|uniref:HEAT repeat-containing protein 3 n=1 Tax=Caerostris extrusa TaxID=172846 RepID=A0AAV4P5Z3_CAEEX|nr:HEAT repeat-containing protein 3 [Caerostris extrusa]